MLLRDKEISELRSQIEETTVANRCHKISASITDVEKNWRIQKLAERYKDLAAKYQDKCDSFRENQSAWMN